jgi:hypothetical protein
MMLDQIQKRGAVRQSSQQCANTLAIGISERPMQACRQKLKLN